MNSEYDIKEAPNGIIVVQQSLKACLKKCIIHLIAKRAEIGKDTPTTLRVKLTGDGTQIARGVTVVNFACTIVEDELAVCVKGNHCIAIMDTYDKLSKGLQNIIDEAKEIKSITIGEVTYNIEFFLGGDWKFLAAACGLEAATAEHACMHLV